jgi:hypothetical protein
MSRTKISITCRQYYRSTRYLDFDFRIALQWLVTAVNDAGWGKCQRNGVNRGGIMDINKILAELRLEREQLGEAILSLERLAAAGAKRRGRPPAWMAKIKDELIEKRRPGRPPGSKNRTAVV